MQRADGPDDADPGEQRLHDLEEQRLDGPGEQRPDGPREQRPNDHGAEP